MLKDAWNLARQWAEEARTQQAIALRQSRWTLGLAAVAAVLAAIVAAVGAADPGAPGVHADTVALHWRWTSILSLVAGFIAAAAALFGRYVQQSSAEKKWIAARAAAEVSQSECYRYAGRVFLYSGADAAQLFDRNIQAIGRTARESGAIPRSATPSTERPVPPSPMTAEWYRMHRLEEQRTWYMEKATMHDRAAGRLRATALGFGLVAALLGLAGALQGLEYLTAGVGAVTTIAGGVAAYGNIERHAHLAENYSSALSRSHCRV